MTGSADTLTVAETALALGVSERTVWRYLSADKLDASTVGPAGAQRTLVARHSVDALASARGRAADAERLRAERDRLQAALERAQRERVQLEHRVTLLQKAVARRPSSAVGDRALDLIYTAIEHLPRRGSSRTAIGA
jgi:hypothetical protein